MRPLRLELEGLRSYRTRQEIDFRDKNLVAIVGNTGAGKSSILEAIVYALYNASTWDERSVEALIADGHAKMEVVFDFETGGRSWRVTRATCRGGQPPSRHKLVCLSDEAVPVLSHERAIKKEISRILGLTYDGFKSAILLPQGQFQALLAAKDRTGILKEVFRLDVQVDAIRKGATDALDRVVQQLDTTTAARGRLLADPSAIARETAGQRLVAERSLSTAKNLAARYDEAKSAAAKAAKENAALERHRGRVAEVLKGDASVLAELVTIQEELQARRNQLEQQQEEASTAAEELAAALAATEDQSMGLSALSAAESVLGRLKTDLPAIATEAQRLADEEKAIHNEADVLHAAAARSTELAESVAATETKLSEATAAVTNAINAQNDVKLQLASARRADAEALDAERQVADARAHLLSTARALAALYDKETSAAEKAAGKTPSTQRHRPRIPAAVDATAAPAELVRIEEDIRGGRERLGNRHKEAAAEAGELASVLKTAEDQGEGVFALSTAESVLGRLGTDLPAIASEKQRLLAEEKAIKEDATALEAAVARSADLAAAVTAGETTLKEATAALTKASTTQNEAKIRLVAARRAEAEAANAGQQAADARTRLAGLERNAQTRAEAHRQAVELAAARQAEYENAQRIHAAAHAAAGLHSGEACPICTRPLPDPFMPPRGDDGRAQTRHEAASKAGTEAQGLLIQAQTDVEAGRRAVEEKDSAVEGRRKDALAGLGVLQALLPSADLTTSDAVILAPLVDAERDLRALLEAAQKARDGALAEQQKHGGSLAPARKNLSERRKTYQEAVEAFGERSRLVDRERESLPEGYRLPPTAPAVLVQDALRRVQERLTSLKDLAERHERATKARDEVALARSSAAKQEAGVEAARNALREKGVAAASRRKETSEAFDALRALLPSADLAAADATNLAPLVTAGKVFRAAREAAQKVRDATLTRQQEHEGSLAPARRTLSERRTRLTEASETLAGRARIVEQERQSLPEAYRPPAGAAIALIEQAQGRVLERLESLRGLAERHERTAKARDEAAHGLSALIKEEATRVTTRDQVAWPRLLILADRAAEAGAEIGLLPVPAPTGNTRLADRSQWARALEETIHSQIGELKKHEEARSTAAARAATDGDRALADGGYASRDDVEPVLSRLSAEALTAKAEERKALAQVPVARALDERIAPATALRDALMALTRLLNDGKFVRFVVERRQQALLAVASTILKSMTRNRYGFAADFRVVDMVTNQARPVETLSGGETFLASLALALGLVELAGRSGGRVDSLILDEGFASLDSAALTYALDELERRAASGKLVALVSHLGAVADMAPEVLYVLQRDGSSVARWRSDGKDDPELDSLDAHLHGT